MIFFWFLASVRILVFVLVLASFRIPLCCYFRYPSLFIALRLIVPFSPFRLKPCRGSAQRRSYGTIAAFSCLPLVDTHRTFQAFGGPPLGSLFFGALFDL